MVYEKWEYQLNIKRENYEINGIVWKTEIVQHALNMQ
jgi:hypothetical protein